MPQPLLGFGLDRTAVLRHHLEFNHFPPVDERWIPIAEKAIDLAVEGSYESDEGFSIEASVLRVEVGQGKTAGEVLDGLHLWPFVESALVSNDEGDEPKAGE
jgi:hypothetical protein